MGNSNTYGGLSYAALNSADYGKQIVRKFVLHTSFHSVEPKHAQYIKKNGHSMNSTDYDDVKNVEMEHDVIDFYFPAQAFESLEKYVQSFGCTMSWREHEESKVNPYEKTKTKYRPPEMIGTLHFNLKSREKLMAIDSYASQPFDNLAEKCLFYKLLSIGIPAVDISGWIVAKPDISEIDEDYHNIPVYITKEVSKNAQLQCVDVSTLKFYHDKYDKYFTSNKKNYIEVDCSISTSNSSNKKQRYIEIAAPVIPEPPTKKQRYG